MKITLHFQGKTWTADLSQPLDISIPIREGENNPNCFYAPFPSATPVVAGDFIGSTRQGGSVNFLNFRLNPHGNGTHTECVGHISKEVYTIHQSLSRFHFIAVLHSVYPTLLENGDKVVTMAAMEGVEILDGVEAFILRTLPNDTTKKTRQYSGTNPPYVDAAVIRFLKSKGIKHLLLDLPSVDREEDGGKLAAHKAFWNYPDSPATNDTITEMIFVDDSLQDGFYLLNIQIASFEWDVSPSKPVMYRLS